MISLLLDSSNKDLLVALAKDNKIIEQIRYECWQRQSELMVKEIENIFKKTNINKLEVNEILIGIGPGSFTGVRIALAIAKTMSLVLNIPIYPISSLHMMKDDDKHSICLINARSKRSYIGVFKGKDVILKDQILSNDEVLKFINEHKDYSIMGDVDYLGLVSKKPDISLQMIDLKPIYGPLNETLGLKPVYLKD